MNARLLSGLNAHLASASKQRTKGHRHRPAELRRFPAPEKPDPSPSSHSSRTSRFAADALASSRKATSTPFPAPGQPWTRSRVRPAAGVKLGPGSRLGPGSESRLGKWVRVKVGRLHARRGRRAVCGGGLRGRGWPNRRGARIASRRKTAESRRIAPGAAKKAESRL